MSRCALPLLLALCCLCNCQTSRPAVPRAMGQMLPPKLSTPSIDSKPLAQAPLPKSPPLAQGPVRPASAKETEGKAQPDLVVRATSPQANDGPVPPLPPGPPIKPPANEPPPQQPPASPTPPSVPPLPVTTASHEDTKPAANDLDKLRQLARVATSKYATIDDYVARFRTRELLPGNVQSNQVMMLKYRRTPRSLFMKWLPGSSAEGRELIRVDGKFNDQLQIRTGKSDPIAGLKIAIDPKSPRATNGTRRNVEDAGIGNMVERFGRSLATFEQGQKSYGTFAYLGPQPREESPGVPMEAVLQEVPPGMEKLLPNGAQRFWYFNANPKNHEMGLPTLIITKDETGREVEYYCYDLVNTNVGLLDADFDPVQVWKKK